MTALATTAGLDGAAATGPSADRGIRWAALLARVGFVLPALVILVDRKSVV